MKSLPTVIPNVVHTKKPLALHLRLLAINIVIHGSGHHITLEKTRKKIHKTCIMRRSSNEDEIQRFKHMVQYKAKY